MLQDRTFAYQGSPILKLKDNNLIPTELGIRLGFKELKVKTIKQAREYVYKVLTNKDFKPISRSEFDDLKDKLNNQGYKVTK